MSTKESIGEEVARPKPEPSGQSEVESPASSPLLGAQSEQEPVLSVVMPTLNEEAGVGECIDRIENALRDLEISGEVIISDSSTDRTPEIASEMGAIVVEPDEPGYGYAYRYAFRYARGEYVAIGDADCTYDFEELPKLYDLVANGDADMAMGSRLEGEIKDGAMPPLHQYVGNPLLTKFLNVFYDAGVSDAHSGMRVMSQDALDELELRTTGMEFASEMIMEAGARDLTIEEVPITYHEREGEATLDSFEDGWRHVKFMLQNAPGYLFSVPGFVMGSIGLLLMSAAYFDIGTAGFTPGTHSMIAGSLLTLVGYQVASLGVFATVASDPIREPEDQVTTWISESLRLEQGATVGTAVFGVGALYAVLLLGQWLNQGLSSLPFVMDAVIALTAIVLGVQIVFGSFFLSSIAE